MCELFAMSSLRPARLTFSLETLAAHGSASGRYRDGWGVAFYQGNDVALFREPTAAGDSPLVRHLEAHGPSTTLAISHIRHATRGMVSLANTQPFVRQVMGRIHVFAHNGDLPGVEASGTLVFDRYRPVGTTDSESASCALFERMQSLWSDSPPLPSLAARLAVIAKFAAELRQLGPANFLYADGDTLFAHSHRRLNPATGEIMPPGLYMLSRRCGDANQSVSAEGVSVAPGFQEVVLVASVPLSAENWQPMVEGGVVAIAAGRVIGALSP